jgi:hypothetical protein
MTFTIASDLAAIVRPGVLWLEDATVVERDHGMDAPLAAAEAAVRINPPAETTSVRTMYKRVGLDPTKRDHRRKRCCAAYGRATRCRASTRWSTYATGARSSSSFRTASTTRRISTAT